jgi:hypothetical protein
MKPEARSPPPLSRNLVRDMRLWRIRQTTARPGRLRGQNVGLTSRPVLRSRLTASPARPSRSAGLRGLGLSR